jgi:diacylglycerol kinase (ATP)
MAVAANGAYYGGGYHPIPEARPDDGILDFLLVKRVSRPTFLQVIGKYKSGEYRKILRHMIRLSGRELRMETERPISVNIDGEILERTSVEIELTGEKLRFFLPDVPEMAMWKNRAHQAINI